MSEPEILFPGSLWLYLGGEKGWNTVHVIQEVDTETDPKMPQIISYSDLDQGDEDEQGWTWRGPLNLFLKEFKPLGFDEEEEV